MGACCSDEKIPEKPKIKLIKYQDLESYVDILEIIQFQKSIQKYKIKYKQDGQEKIMAVIQKQQEQYLNLILNANSWNLQKVEQIFQTDQNSIVIQTNQECEPIFQYCQNNISILDEQLIKQLFKQLIQVIKLILDTKLVLNFNSPSQILVTKDGKIILEGILVKEITMNFVASIFSPPEGDESSLENQIVWKCGIILLILLTGTLPNKFTFLFPYQIKVLDKDQLFDPNDPNLTFLQKKIIQEMLKENPSERISLAKILTHQWVNTHSNNVTPRQIINQEKIQFKKDLVQSLDIETYLRQFIATNSFVLMTFNNFNLLLQNLIQQPEDTQKRLIVQNQIGLQIKNQLKNQIKNEAILLSIFQNKKINSKEDIINLLQEWKSNIIKLTTQKLQQCFSNGIVKSTQVKRYLEARQLAEVNSIIISIKSKNSFELQKIDYSFEEFIQYLMTEIHEKIKDQINNQNLTIMELQEIMNEFNDLKHILETEQAYIQNQQIQKIIQDINDILVNCKQFQNEEQKLVYKLLSDFQKQYQSKKTRLIVRQLINKLQY